MKTVIAGSNRMAGVVPARGTGIHEWQRWAPYAAVIWSVVYAALGIYWAVSGRGFPYTSVTVADSLGRIVVYVAMVAPVSFVITRYAWALV